MFLLRRLLGNPLPLAVLLIGLSACSVPSNTSGSPRNTTSGAGATPPTSPATEDKLRVVTTFLPMTQFTKAVAGDCAEVTQLLPSNVGPHDYQAKPSDAQSLAQADVLVQNGLELESFLEPMIENAGNPNLQVITSSDGLSLLAMAEGGHDHAHDHAHDEDHGDEHGDEHDHGEKSAGEGEAHAGHDHGEFDPHVWLDPLLAVEQVSNIRDGLIAAQPACTDEFTANAAAYTAQLQALHQEIEQTLAPYAGKTFVTYHDFANYFANRYGLQTEFLVGVPEQNPSPEDVKRVMTAAQASELKTLLTESENSARAFEALAKDLNVSVSTFKPNEAGGAGSTEPGYYLQVLRENVENLKIAFAGS